MGIESFREIVVADFEFAAIPGERPVPLCLVAHELRSGRRFRILENQFGPAPPFATGPDVLFVAFYASAELGCYRVLGWPMPERILDLFIEFRVRTNMSAKVDQERRTPSGAGLLGALAYFGLDAMGATEKDEMRKLILRGGPGPRASERQFWITARKTWWRSSDCWLPCYRASICLGRYCVAAIWPLPPPWSTTELLST
jgi:DNA polymerase-1